MRFGDNSAASRDKAYHIHPYTNLHSFAERGPLVIASGRGVYVTDEDGRDYLEAMSGLWCVSLGFSEPRLVAAATKQLETLPFYHSFAGRTTGPISELAARLVELAPAPLTHALFCNSGSEATDTAVKLVWYYNNALGRPLKKKILSRLKGYHGVTVASASLTGLPNNHRDWDLPIANIRHADCPYAYRHAKPGESDADFAVRLAESLEAQILREGPDTIAAFIAEPLQGAGGVIIPPAGYWPLIQAVLKKYDILLIADEVITGFGRTSAMFGCESFGITPDMMTVAKQLSSGYLPIAATLISEPIHQALLRQSDKIGVFAHGFTYSGHPVPAAIALETLAIYAERDIIGHVQAVAPDFQAILRSFADRDFVGEARGIGLIGALELVQDKASKAPFPANRGAGFKFQELALSYGLIIRPLGDTIALCPPLIVTSADLIQIKEKLTRTMDAFDDWARQLPELIKP